MAEHLDDAARRRAERRAFIRAEHPDAGGDPRRFADGLAAFDRTPADRTPADRTPADRAAARSAGTGGQPRMQVYRSRRLDRVVLKAVRDWRRRATGTPTRKLR